MSEKLVWIGVRESDIADTGNLFYKSITIHGSGNDRNVSMDKESGIRFNHNIEISEYDHFFQKTMKEMLEKDSEIRFFQYDQFDSKDFSDELKDKINYKNSYDLLDFLSDKISHKVWASKYTNILPYRIITVGQLNSFMNHEVHSGSFVVQFRFSCGGTGTFLVSANNISNLLKENEEQEQCIVTEFKENNVPINFHAAIYKKDIVLFPPSIQLININEQCLEYIGSDFTAYKGLSKDEQRLVYEEGMKICKALQSKGYLGVCGIDMILTGGKCFFMEVNARFQASSALLNKNLALNGYPTLQSYHINAFEGDISSLPKPVFHPEGSMVTFSYQHENKKKLMWLYDRLRESKFFSLCDDSLSWNMKMENGCYLFRLYSSTAISSITFQHTVRLHPNMKLCNYILDVSLSEANLMNLKIILISRGIFISQCALKKFKDLGGVDWEEFGAITFKIFDNIWITAPCFEKWHEVSPAELDYDDESKQFVILYYGEKLFKTEVMKIDPNGEKITCNGHFVKDIVYLNPDRLRVYHRNGCAFQDAGLGCKFCDLYGVDRPFCFAEICEALSYYKDDDTVQHYLIGGGSELDNNNCGTIIKIAKFIHSGNNKNIYLMCQPITDRRILNELKLCGVTQVAFNIEMFNRCIADIIMPGKSKNSLQDYYSSLKMAVELWGNKGNVRSIILLGFDDIQEFELGIRELCKIGVTPILSLFRPCPKTPFENFMPLDENIAMNYYITAKRVCEEYGMKLGPACKACQNNTVTLEL